MSQDNTLVLNEIEEIKNKAVFTLTKFINLYGLTLSEARLFSIMYIENRPMTLDEMSNSLGMSKTSMSTGVRSLLDAQLVERRWKKGIRKDLYSVEENLYKSFSNNFIEHWLTETQHSIKTFNEISKQLRVLSQKVEDTSKQNSLTQYIQKLDNIIRFYEWLAETFREIQAKIESQQGM